MIQCSGELICSTEVQLREVRRYSGFSGLQWWVLCPNGYFGERKLCPGRRKFVQGWLRVVKVVKGGHEKSRTFRDGEGLLSFIRESYPRR